MTATFSVVNFCIFLALCIQSTAKGETVTRTSNAGELTGFKLIVLGKTVESYQSIPYAEPPIGDNRFKRTILKQNWTGVLDATKKPNTCVQIVPKGNNFAGINTNISEDCLYLNIWTPVPRGSQGGKAVMIYIYGGAFVSGTSTLALYDGSAIASAGDVVVVSMNYRLAVLGFYFLGTPDAPGNMGLLDQSTAIQWVVNNIASFGGDPQRITVFGESAGSISTSFHLFSEISRDLFQYALMESGSAINTNSFSQPDEVIEYSLKLAEIVGCDSTKPADQVVTCLKGIDPLVLTGNMYSVNDDGSIVNRFTPTVDDYFLTATPADYIARGNYKKTNVLAGVNQDEGTYLVMVPKPAVPSVFNLVVTDPITWAQFNLTVETVLSTEPEVVRDAVRFYYSTKDGFNATSPGTVSLFNAYSIVGDRLIACSTVAQADAYAANNQTVYAYLFDHKSTANPWPAWMGAMHTGELEYVFGLPLVEPNNSYTTDEKDLSKRFIQHWTNFAKTGNPNTDENGTNTLSYTWPVYTYDDKKYQLLKVGSNDVEQGLLYQRCQFWNTFVPQLRAFAAFSKLPDYISNCGVRTDLNFHLSFS